VGGPDLGPDRLGVLPEAHLIAQVRTDMNRLRGRLFQLIELADLSSRQEAAFKGCVRTTTYDAQADLEALLRERP
jgi:hypothetical protein